MTELSLRVTRTINAPIEAVFNAWLDPAMLVRFMTPGEGVTVPKAETDARVGGRFDIVMTAGEKELPHSGTYLGIALFRRGQHGYAEPCAKCGRRHRCRTIARKIPIRGKPKQP